ncbi:MAG: resuscitation-promoting factor [Arachnia sp.]
MRKKLWIPTAAGSVALALVATTGIATAMHKNDVDLVVDGVSSTIAVRENTVGEVMELEGITVEEHDILLPSADTRVTDGMEITVAYGRPLTVTVDGQEREVWTTAQNVGDALAFLNLDKKDSKLSASRSTEIGREGLTMELATAQDVTMTLAGVATEMTIAGTVADALAAADVTPDADDIVTPAADTVLTDGLAIAFVDVEVTSSTKKVDIAFTKSQKTSSDMEKGTQKITTKGVEGSTRETYTDVLHDGVLFSSTLTESVVSQQPVQQVTTVGTKVVVEAPAPAPAPAASDAGEASSGTAKTAEPEAAAPEESSSSSSGAGINTARAAMWDRIATCESGNNWSINTGNGYYGGLQFNAATWRSVNGQDFAALPHQASREQQITVANRLYELRGTQPWSCA